MDEFLGKNDIEYAEVPVGVNGDVVRIGSLTAGDMIEWAEANEGEAKRTAGLRLIVKSLVDEQGNRIGKDSDIPRLRGKSQKWTQAIVKEILKHNGLEPKAQEEVKKD